MRLVVVGSLNLDTTIWLPRRPLPDETIHVSRIGTFCGGKGANQAVAAARLGAEVTMVGCVGNDIAGRELRTALEADGVDVSHVTTIDERTGSAYPIVSPDDVSVLVHAGANASLTPEGVEAASDRVREADVLLLQGEVPKEASRRAAEIARDADVTVLFNPAPPLADVFDAVAPLATIIVVNRVEREALEIPESAEVVVTLGADGAEVEGARIPSPPAEVVDPTGAGDAFCAGLSVGLGAGRSIREAARLGAVMGSLAVRAPGAQPSFPDRSAVEALLGRSID